jgi:hypothetical protein
MQTQNGNPALSVWLRLFFMAVILILTLGVALFFAPELVARRWPWSLTPFNTRFLGAIYASELVVVLGLLLINRWTPARVALPIALVFTGIVTIVSLIYPDNFNFQRRVTWIWFTVYLVSALISAYFLWLYRHLARPAVARPLAGLWRLSLWGEGVALGFYGLGLLAAPALFTAFWPWKVDDFHGQLYSALFIGAAVGSFILARAAAPIELMLIGLAEIVLGALAIAGLVIVDASVHKINWALPGIWFWLALFFSLLLLGLGKLWRSLENKHPINNHQAFSSHTV